MPRTVDLLVLSPDQRSELQGWVAGLGTPEANGEDEARARIGHDWDGSRRQDKPDCDTTSALTRPDTLG
jgi:hypothetical protein